MHYSVNHDLPEKISKASMSSIFEKMMCDIFSIKKLVNNNWSIEDSRINLHIRLRFGMNKEYAEKQTF